MQPPSLAQPPFAELGVHPLSQLRGYPYTRTYWPAATGAVGQAASVRVGEVRAGSTECSRVPQGQRRTLGEVRAERRTLPQTSFEAGMVPLQLRKNPSLRSGAFKTPQRRGAPSPRHVSHEAFLWGPSPWDSVVSTARMIAASGSGSASPPSDEVLRSARTSTNHAPRAALTEQAMVPPSRAPAGFAVQDPFALLGVTRDAIAAAPPLGPSGAPLGVAPAFLGFHQRSPLASPTFCVSPVVAPPSSPSA
jgi:hypothetical protein